MGGQQCPAVDPASGYTITATTDSPRVDAAWLTSFATAVAYRWKVPSHRRALYSGWENVRRRLLPPEPRWADDWTPQPRHHARVRVTLNRDHHQTRFQLTSASGDRLFDQSLESFLKDPMPASPGLPDIPSGASVDSLSVVLLFGDTTDAPLRGTIRFAASQTRGELHRNTLRVESPAGYRGPFPPTTVKYDVLETGLVDLESIEFVRRSGGQFENAIREGLRSARFTPPTSNCKAISQSVVQTFGS